MTILYDSGSAAPDTILRQAMAQTMLAMGNQSADVSDLPQILTNELDR